MVESPLQTLGLDGTGGAETNQDGWPAEELGVLTIAPWGWESPTVWGVTVTNRVVDGVFCLVDKTTGDVTEPPWTSYLEARNRMSKVGDWTGVE